MALMHPVAAAATALSLALSVGAASAQTADKPAAKAPAKPTKKAAAKPAVYTPPAATPEQVEAAGRVRNGVHDDPGWLRRPTRGCLRLQSWVRAGQERPDQRCMA